MMGILNAEQQAGNVAILNGLLKVGLGALSCNPISIISGVMAAATGKLTAKRKEKQIRDTLH